MGEKKEGVPPRECQGNFLYNLNQVKSPEQQKNNKYMYV